jgi:VanZ family protein
MNIGANQSQFGLVSFFTRNAVLRRLPALLVMAGIWFLSSQSILPTPKGVFGFDKVQHFIAYFVLAVSLGLWFFSGRPQKRQWAPCVASAAIASAYGIIDEIHQYFVPGRDCNIWDWIADSAGAVMGGLAVLFLFRVINRRGVRAVPAPEQGRQTGEEG